jgi:hypothetical protein
MDAPLAALTARYHPGGSQNTGPWTNAEERLGTDLPQDYKELIGTFGGGRFDGELWLLEPDCPNPQFDLASDNEGRMEDFEDFWDMGEEKPAELSEEDSRLIAWGSTNSGAILFWLVLPGRNPDTWTVMVNESRGPRWEHHAMTCTDFLASLLTGRLASGILGSRFPAAQAEFRSVRTLG